jgi:AmmeMemoRadiSam system protein B
MGVIAPHAGHRYSGQVAAYAFNCLRGLHPDLVAVVSPMHHPYRAALLTTGHEAYRTPLGEVPVDRAAVEALGKRVSKRLNLELTSIRNDPEHALEIELPFLQCVLGSFRLLPVMVMDQEAETARGLGSALAEVLKDRQALLVASSDLSHYFPQATAEVFDEEMLRRVEAFDPERVMSAEEEGVGFACGRAAIAAVLWAARELGADRVRVLKHATSGEVTGDYEAVVGYGAAVIWHSPGEAGPVVSSQ